MDHRAQLRDFVTRAGGARHAAEILNAAEQTIRGVLNGWRGVSKEQAREWADRSGGALAADELVWIRATKKPGAAKRAPRKRKPATRRR